MRNSFVTRDVRLAGAALCGIIATVVVTATTAVAGPFKEVAPPPPVEEIDWNGIYMGFNVGVVFDNYDVRDYGGAVNLGEQLNNAVMANGLGEDEMTDPYYAGFSFPGGSGTDTAPIGGLHIGYRKQFGHFVAGIEFGFEGTQTSKGPQSRVFQENFMTDYDESEVLAFSRWDSYRYAERNWDGWAGGQIGYAWQRFLFYANGGYTFADVGVHSFDRVKSEFVDDGGEDFIVYASNAYATVSSDIMQGFYAGGGVQYALNQKVTLGLEYRYSDFGNETFRFHQAHPIFPGATNVSLTTNQVEFVVNIMLGHLGH
jgi:outer membrane immunogenic protein